MAEAEREQKRRWGDSRTDGETEARKGGRGAQREDERQEGERGRRERRRARLRRA